MVAPTKVVSIVVIEMYAKVKQANLQSGNGNCVNYVKMNSAYG